MTRDGHAVLRIAAGNVRGLPAEAQWSTTPSGFEQSWIIPEGVGGGLTIDVAVDVPVVPDGDGVAFWDHEGRPWTVLPPTAWDARGLDLPASMVATGTGYTVVVDDRAAIFPVTVDPFYVAGTLVFDDTWIESSVWTAGALGDVDGDGNDDVFISIDGALLVYLGGVHAPGVAPDSIVTGGDVWFGRYVVALGDIDQDGFDDVAVAGDTTVEVFRGSADGLGSASRVVPGIGRFSLDLAGDVNGDGHVDLVTVNRLDDASTLVMLYGDGSSFTASEAVFAGDLPADTGYGWYVPPEGKVDGAGDINGDGFDDVVYATPTWDYGRIGVFLGSASGLGSGPDREFNVAGEHAASGVEAVGDANGDGFPELTWDAGYLRLAYGDGDGWDTAANTILDPSDGVSVASASDGHRDVDGDGYADLLVLWASPDATPDGAHVWYGGPGGFSEDALDATPTFDGKINEVVWAGDVDGDGDQEVIGIGNGTSVALVEWGPAGDPDGDGYQDDVDCDSDDAQSFPGAVERCDGRDNNCDGAADEPLAPDAPWWWRDGDGDGFGAGASTQRCRAELDEVSAETPVDCNDAAAWINPQASEVCNGQDDDCDGAVDEGPPADAATWLTDADGDGYGAPETELTSCDPPLPAVVAAGDCDDTNPAIHPGAAEVEGNGVDEDCDGEAARSCGCGTGGSAGLLLLLIPWHRRRAQRRRSISSRYTGSYT